MAEIKRISMQKADIILHDDGIIENIIKEGVVWETEDVLETKKANISLANGKKYALLVSAGPLSTVSKEARELSASKDFSNTTIAKALLVDSLGQRIVGNFYMQINKPAIKTQLFSNREEALAWLKKQLKN